MSRRMTRERAYRWYHWSVGFKWTYRTFLLIFSLLLVVSSPFPYTICR